MKQLFYFLELLGMFLLGALTGMIASAYMKSEDVIDNHTYKNIHGTWVHDPECQFCYDVFD